MDLQTGAQQQVRFLPFLSPSLPQDGSPYDFLQVAQHEDSIRCIKFFEAGGSPMLGAFLSFRFSSTSFTHFCSCSSHWILGQGTLKLSSDSCNASLTSSSADTQILGPATADSRHYRPASRAVLRYALFLPSQPQPHADLVLAQLSTSPTLSWSLERRSVRFRSSTSPTLVRLSRPSRRRCDGRHGQCVSLLAASAKLELTLLLSQLACFPDAMGYAIGTIEGRVAIQCVLSALLSSLLAVLTFRADLPRSIGTSTTSQQAATSPSRFDSLFSSL